MVREMRLRHAALAGLLLFAPALPAQVVNDPAQKVFFENSRNPLRYYYSDVHESLPSRIDSVDRKIPINSDRFVSPPNSLDLHWTSRANGGWVAEIKLQRWRNRAMYFPGRNLYLWLYAKDGLTAAAMPMLALRDLDGGFSRPVPLSRFAHDLPAGRWVRVGIPLTAFPTASLSLLSPHQLESILFVQGEADGADHDLLIDDIHIEDPPPANEAAPLPVKSLTARGYERHIDLEWTPTSDAGVAQYIIYRSVNGGPYRAIGMQWPGYNLYTDYVGTAIHEASYKVAARTSTLRESPLSAPATAATHAMTDDELLTMVQEASFRYYWKAAEPHSGMTRENRPGNDDMIALGASGFGIMALVAAVDRGFITREQGVDRMLQITSFLERADRYHGAWSHFISGRTGHTLPVFGMFDNGADLVETSFLMEGLLTARQYFSGSDTQEQELRQRITRLWEGVEWDWFLTPKRDALWWHWSPDYSYYIANRLTGWNEVMITYLLAIASPTHGIPASAWITGWTGGGIGLPYANGKTYYGIELPVGGGTGGPLFFTDYSFMGLNPARVTDKYTNYLDQVKAQTLINYRYCLADPGHWKGYGADDWGITAVDGPDGYVPYEPTPSLDDGTIAPTGAVSAIAYEPEQSMAAIRHWYRDLGAQTWGIYGFVDAFNESDDWTSVITMGLNQAPQVAMIENSRTGLIWRMFLSNPEIEPALEKVAEQK
jgi:exo beta-1,2-glucooligosaccharide sophorohydrolase (non-reducing end)